MSQTRLDYNGSSGKFSSLQAGSIATDAAPAPYTFVLGTATTAIGFTGAITSAGAHLLEGTLTDGSFSNIFHVSKRGTDLYLIDAGSAVTGGTISGVWTTTSLTVGGVLTLTRAGNTADTLVATIRKL